MSEISAYAIQRLKADPEWAEKRAEQTAQRPDCAKYRHCPVCGATRSHETMLALVGAENSDIDTWICPGECERKWWGARDLIAILQREDANRQPVKRLGRPLLHEERQRDVMPSQGTAQPGRA